MTAQDQMLAAPPPAAGLDIAPQLAIDDEPYPGLRSFRRDETHIFFGREGTINEMVDRLAAHRFLAITGASGSGKSSLVRTGLLDALDRGLLAEAGPVWHVADFRPGDRPMAALTKALVTAIGADFSDDECAVIDARLARGPLGLVDWLDEVKFPANANLLLLADQFEELFRYRRGNASEEIEAFVALLLASAAQRKRRIYVVITMRSDFLGECARYFGLAQAINDGQFLTPRLTRQQCQEAIEGPATVYGGRVEKPLVTRLLNDMGSNPDQLPLMQHILMLMWQNASSRTPGGDVTLALADYEALGGVSSDLSAESADAGDDPAAPQQAAEGALSKHADRILQSLTPEQQRLAAILFRALIQTEGNIGRDVRRPVSLRQAARIAEVEAGELLPVIEAFRAPGRNFLMPAPPVAIAPDTVVDISHESLIRQWGTMRGWVREEFQSAETYRHIEKTAKLWAKREAGLLTMPYLGLALAWRAKEHPNPAWASRYGGDFPLAMRFLDTSGRRSTRRRWLAISTVACLVVGAVAFGIYQYQAAQASAEALRLAQINIADELTDFRVPPQTTLKEDVGTSTPLTIPGGTVLSTPALISLIRNEPEVILVDAFEAQHELSLPGAVRIPVAGRFGTFDDSVQRFVKRRLDNLTDGNPDADIVVFCTGARCWESYNAALRAMHAGYRHVFWYRGGLEAWRAGQSRTQESISQRAKGIEQQLLVDAPTPRQAWNAAVSLAIAASVLLDLPQPDINGAFVAAARARDVLQSLRTPLADNPDLLSDLADTYVQMAKVYGQQRNTDRQIASYREAEAVRRTLAKTEPANLDRQSDIAEILFEIGDLFKSQNKLDDALQPFRNAQDIWQMLADKQPGNKVWRRDLSLTENRIGQILANKGDYAEALKVHRASAEIHKKLVDESPDSSSDLGNLWVDLFNIGDTLASLHQYDEAIASYRQAVLVLEKLIEKAPTEGLWRHDLSLTHIWIGDAFRAQGKLELAVDAYQAAVKSAKATLDRNGADIRAQGDLADAARRIGGEAYEFVLGSNFAKGLEAADIANALIPGEVWIQGNRAHALMFLGRIDEARTVYLRFRGQKSNGDKLWESDILADFAELRKHGLTNPLMDEIEKLFGPANP